MTRYFTPGSRTSEEYGAEPAALAVSPTTGDMFATGKVNRTCGTVACSP
jgi:hypothetical protein